MTEVVLDASALLARILHEPGGDRVAGVIDGARVSAVNLAEVTHKLVDLGLEETAILEILDALPCEIQPFSAADGRRAGLLRRVTRRAGLSLGDRACLELGARLNMSVFTADRAWAELDLNVEVVLIR